MAHYYLGNAYSAVENNIKAIFSYLKAIDTGVDFTKNNDLIPKQIAFLYLTQAFNFILSNIQSIDFKDFKKLENTILKDYGFPPELEIVYRYLQTYRRYVLERDEKALLELPKEQRQFFVKEILGK
jgi:hypothetical protein